jgi:hypothetical protein
MELQQFVRYIPHHKRAAVYGLGLDRICLAANINGFGSSGGVIVGLQRMTVVQNK